MFENVKAAFAQAKAKAVEYKNKITGIDWMKWTKKTFKVCRWFNVELTRAFGTITTIHWSVILLLLYLLVFKGAMMAGLFALALLSVVPHEYGHALAAMYYKLKTRNIYIYPVGGVALVEGGPEVANQMVRGKELVIAAAGPAVSFALAFFGLMGVWLSGPGHMNVMQHPETGEYLIHQGYNISGFWFYLFVINTGMVLFNLIPAFPMDGGRIFRASLSFWLGELKATKVAYYVSVGLCWMLSFLGLLLMAPSLILIPLLVMWMARMELRRVEMLEAAAQQAQAAPVAAKKETS